MSTRNLGNFLRAYMEFTRETESSDQYHFWTACCLIAAATKRQVWSELNMFRVYPNLFVFLVGPPGGKKSVAGNIGVAFADKLGIKRLSNKITAAALIRDLSEATEKRIEEGGGTVQLCSPMLIYASELGVFLGSDAYSTGVVADLTDLYDCPSKWEKKTISRDAETVIAPFVTFLAATTPQTLKGCLPSDAVGQGFTSRVLFVWAAGRRKRVPIPPWGSEYEMLEKNLLHDLQAISRLHGKFEFTPGGLEAYQHNYMERPEPEDEFEDERLRGYSSRKDIHMLKVAQILSLADRDDLTITEKEIAGSIDAFKWLDSGLSNVFAGHGAAATSQDVVRIFKQIETATNRNGYVSHAELLKRNYYHINASEFAMVLETLSQAQAIEGVVSRDPRSNKVTTLYKVIDRNFIEKMKSGVVTKALKEED